jgi:hypothetical protein
VENEIKELEPMKAYKYLSVEENNNIEHKNETEKLKEEYVRRLTDFERRAKRKK